MDLVWYHGTTRPFKRLRPSARGLFGRGVYLTSDAADAQGYGPWLAIVRTCVRRPLKAKADYTLGQLLETLFGAEGAARMLLRMRHGSDELLGEEVAQAAMRLGYDALLLDWGPVDHLVVFDARSLWIERWEYADGPIFC